MPIALTDSQMTEVMARRGRKASLRHCAAATCQFVGKFQINWARRDSNSQNHCGEPPGCHRPFL
jgi:hypothetical protein